MRVLGFDISTVATGWAIVDDGVLKHRGVIRPIKDLAKSEGKTQKAVREALTEITRFAHIVNRASILFDNFRPNLVVIEDTFVKMFPGQKINGNVQRLLARISGGVLWEWIEKYDGTAKNVIIVMASKARAGIGCKGTAKKPEVIQFIRDEYGLIIEDDNEADAYVLAKYGTWVQSGSPKARRKTKRRWKR